MSLPCEVPLSRALWYPTGIFPRTLVVPCRSGGSGYTISISGKVLTEAGVDISKELFGVWKVEGDVALLEISYERKRGAYKLMRMNSYWSRSVYPPAILRKLLGGKSCTWVVRGQKLLELVPTSLMLRVQHVVGTAQFHNNFIELPHVVRFRSRHVIVGVTGRAITFVPDECGIRVDDVCDNALRVNLVTPVRAAMVRRGLELRGGEDSVKTAVLGELRVFQPRKVTARECLAILI